MQLKLFDYKRITNIRCEPVPSISILEKLSGKNQRVIAENCTLRQQKTIILTQKLRDSASPLVDACELK